MIHMLALDKPAQCDFFPGHSYASCCLNKWFLAQYFISLYTLYNLHTKT